MPEIAAPIHPDLIQPTSGGIALIASREHATGRIVFPARPQSDDRFERVTLPREGRLWSWTIQRFRPKSPPYNGPDAFAPYAVGYVELDGALIVEARLTDAPFEELSIGMAMRLVPLPFTTADGTAFTTYAFTPAPTQGDAA